MQIKSQFISNVRFISESFLLCLVIFLFSLLFSSEAHPVEEEFGLPKRVHLEYNSSILRDPFYPQVFISEESNDLEELRVEIKEEIKLKASELFSLTIQGIIWNTDNPLAIINNQVFKKGAVLSTQTRAGGSEKITILDIDKDGVTIVYAGEVERLPAPSALGIMQKRRSK